MPAWHRYRGRVSPLLPVRAGWGSLWVWGLPCGPQDISARKWHARVKLLWTHTSLFKRLHLKPQSHCNCITVANEYLQMWITHVQGHSQRPNQPKCSTVANWLSKVWYNNTMEYYTAIEKNGAVFYVLLGKLCWINTVKWRNARYQIMNNTLSV